ncbi:ATP-binding protein [Desulfoluna limicola]|nr:ATP-binding protein [Desulfoluna limicola]
MMRFRSKLMLFFLPFFALFSIVVFFYNHMENRDMIREEIRGKGRVMVESLSHACEFGVLSSDATLLNWATRNVAAHDGVVLLVVYDALGNVLLERNQRSVASSAFPGAPEPGMSVREREVRRDDRLVALDFLAPIYHASFYDMGSPSGFPAKQVIGYIRMGISTEDLDRKLQSSFMGSLAIDLAFLLLGTLVIIGFSGHLTRPITRLSNVVRRFGDGEATLPVAVDTRDEIGLLAENFNTMAKSLEESRLALQAHHDALEKTVMERTGKLKESEERFRQLAENITEVFWIRSLDWKEVHYVSPAYETHWGYRCEDVYADPFSWLEHVMEEDRENVESCLRTMACEAHPVVFPEFQARWADGSVRWIEVRWFPIVDDDGVPSRIAGIARDITRHKESERVIKESQERTSRMKRMEALGVMASGIAHDLNNILSAIVGYPDLILLDLPEESSMVRPLKMIKQSGERAADIVTDLLTVARGVAVDKDVHSLNLSIREYVASAEFRKLEHLHPDVAYTLDLEEALLNARYSPSHIRKSIMNLVTNASEAIEGAGEVTISTRNIYLDRPLSGYEDVSRGEYAVITVQDTGSGISPEDLERIFEPFYSRKVLGRSGSGLGLSVVWNTVRDHGGYINVTSGEAGTAFDIYLPVTRDESTSLVETGATLDLKGGGESILVIDDEPHQREIACRMLASLGYTPQAVKSGEEAVEYLKRVKVDLLLLDMVMYPGMGGGEAYKKALDVAPGQRAVIASGYADSEAVKEAQRLGAGPYIRKPYTLERIGIAIKEELARER